MLNSIKVATYAINDEVSIIDDMINVVIILDKEDPTVGNAFKDDWKLNNGAAIVAASLISILAAKKGKDVMIHITSNAAEAHTYNKEVYSINGRTHNRHDAEYKWYSDRDTMCYDILKDDGFDISNINVDLFKRTTFNNNDYINLISAIALLPVEALTEGLHMARVIYTCALA